MGVWGVCRLIVCSVPGTVPDVGGKKGELDAFLAIWS